MSLSDRKSYLYRYKPPMKTVYRKLEAYSAAAIALMAVKTAEAQVHYADVDPDIVLDSPDAFALIDLNGDGLADIKFANQSFYLLLWTFYSEEKPYLFQYINASAYAELFAYNENSVAYTGSEGGLSGGVWHVAKAIEEGEVVNAELDFEEWGVPMAEKIYSCTLTAGFGATSCVFSDSVGKWQPELANRFIGLHFTNITDIGYFGWIRCSIANDGRKLTIHDYAYNATPEQAIIAGDTLAVGISEATLQGTQMYTDGNNVLHAKTTSSGNTRLQLFDISGREIVFLQNNIGEFNYDLTALPAGPYIVRLTQGASSSTIKIIRK